jgi:phytanoyl-CoA hydroxylase
LHWNPNKEIDSFGTTESENTARGDYFLESSDKIHYFAEPDAMADGSLKPEYADNKLEALNKAGHAMHLQPGSVFHSYCMSDKIRTLVKTELGWKNPVVPQSMYIFKQARLGGAVNSHQDSTFLYTTPRQSCLGLWLALDEATLDNGCLWVRPKSHREAVRRRYGRNPLHFGQEQIDTRSNDPKGNASSQPMFVMEELYTHDIVWDGDLPKGKDGTTAALLDAGFIPIECGPGDLVTFCGELDHLSLPNTSARARHTFQLHLVEGPSAGIEWSTINWLQYPDGKPFMSI